MLWLPRYKTGGQQWQPFGQIFGKEALQIFLFPERQNFMTININRLFQFPRKKTGGQDWLQFGLTSEKKPSNNPKPVNHPED